MNKIDIYTYETIKNCPYTAIILIPPRVYHRSTFFKIMFVEEGEANIFMYPRGEKGNALRRKISAGDALIVSPEDVHRYELTGAERYIHRDVYVSAELMQICCGQLSPSLYREITGGRYPQFFRLSNNTVLSLAENLSPLVSKHKSADLEGIHKSIVLYLLGCYLSKRQTAKIYPDWLKRLLRDLSLEEFMVQPLTKIVERTNYSHGHVSREFKRYMGKSLKQYINETKLEYSCTLLCSRERYSVESIALRLDFTTQSNYINLFKRKFGISPGKYRLSVRNNIETDTYTEWGEKYTEEE